MIGSQASWSWNSWLTRSNGVAGWHLHASTHSSCGYRWVNIPPTAAAGLEFWPEVAIFNRPLVQPLGRIKIKLPIHRRLTGNFSCFVMLCLLAGDRRIKVCLRLRELYASRKLVGQLAISVVLRCVDFWVRKCVKTVAILFCPPRAFPLSVWVNLRRQFWIFTHKSTLL